MTKPANARTEPSEFISGLDRLLHALDDIDIDTQEWTATIGPRQLSGGSARDLRPQLMRALYEVFHAGRAEDKELGRIVREHDVESILGPSVPHTRTPALARFREWRGEEAVVSLPEVTVRVPRSYVHTDQDVSPGSIVRLDLPSAKPGLSHGFYMIDGPQGHRDGPSRGTRRLYLHARDVDSAASLWGLALGALNDAGVPYRSKALSHLDGYPRCDSVVIYLPVEHAAVVDSVVEVTRGHEGLNSETSLFAYPLAPGIAIADDPADPRPGYQGLSFGEHRASAVSIALVKYALKQSDSLIGLLRAEFTAAGIDPREPAFNRTAPDTQDK